MPLQFGYTKQATLAILPKISSFISMCGASWIIVEVAGSHAKRHSVYNRLLFCMSIFDFLVCMSYFASTWPIPRDSPGVLWALGTTQSCTAQGFFIQLGIVAPLYNCCLSIYYMLVVKYGVPEDYMARNVEPWMHLGCLSIGLATAVASLPLTLFNNADLWCWIAPLPFNCNDSVTYGETTCIRGDNAWIYRWAFFYAPLWASLLLVTIVNVVVYLTVRKGEKEAIMKHNEHHVRHGQRTAKDAFHRIVHSQQKCRDEHETPKKKGRNTSVRLEGAPHHPRRMTIFSASSCVKRPSFFGFDGFKLASSVDAGIGGVGTVAQFVLPEKLVEKFKGSSFLSATNHSTDSPPAHQRQHAEQGGERTNSSRDPHASIRSSDIEFVLETIEDYPSAARQHAAAYQYGARVILYQSLAYTGAFYLVWLFPSINRIFQHRTGENSFGLLFMESLFEPLQGLCNVLVYRFAFHLRLKQRNPHLTRWELFQYTWRWSFMGPLPNANEPSNRTARANTLGRLGRLSSVFGPNQKDSFMGRGSTSRTSSRPSAHRTVAGVQQWVPQSASRNTSAERGNRTDHVGFNESGSVIDSDDEHGVVFRTEAEFLDAQDHFDSILGDLMTDYYENPASLNGPMVVVKTELPTAGSSIVQPSLVDPPQTSTPSSFPVIVQDLSMKDSDGGMVGTEFPHQDNER